MKNKGVLYFGSYDPNYSRNRILIKGLKANNINVLADQAKGNILIRYSKLTYTFFKLHKRVNAIIVGFPGHYDTVLAYVLGKIFNKKVFFDIFASTYETYVLDRKLIKIGSPRATFFFILDRIGLILSDHIIADTSAHADYYSNLYKVRRSKFIVVYVGSDSQLFRPGKVREETDVLFYGSYQPLQGTDRIIRAASLLPNVSFKMIGEGQTRPQAEKLAKDLNLENVEFVNWIPIQKLAKEINKSKIMLGIFGRTPKSEVVISNKVYDGLASKKAIITAKTKAATEILSDSKNALLVNPSSSRTLANAIKTLIENKKIRNKIAEGGLNLYQKNLLPQKVVESLLPYL